MRYFTQMCWCIPLGPANIFLQVRHREHLFALSQSVASNNYEQFSFMNETKVFKSSLWKFCKLCNYGTNTETI